MERKLKEFTQSPKLRETLSNIALAAFYALFVYRFATHYIDTHRLSSLLYVFVESMFFIIAFTRRKPSKISTSFITWIISLWGGVLAFVGLTNRDQRPFFGTGITNPGDFTSGLCDSIPQ